MSDFIDILNEAELLALEWLDFSQATHGWDTREYNGIVRCYFAAESDHRSVTFGCFGCRLAVVFFSPVQFSGITYKSVNNAERILAEARALLASEREAVIRLSDKEAAANRAARAEKLRMELAQLESEAA